MSGQRVGWGFDAHRFGGEPPLILAGVEAAPDRGVEATSNGDLVVHAVVDALLGASALGDLGTYFPSDDPRWRGVDSFDLLEHALAEIAAAGWKPESIDITVIAQSVRIGPIRHRMRQRLSKALDLDVTSVSIKATTTDRMGWIGRDEGLAAVALATIGRVTPTRPESDPGLLAVLARRRREPGVDETRWRESLDADAVSEDPGRWAAALRDIHHARHTDGVSQALTGLMASLRERVAPIVARQLGVDDETAKAAIDRALSQSEPPIP